MEYDETDDLEMALAEAEWQEGDDELLAEDSRDLQEFLDEAGDLVGSWSDDDYVDGPVARITLWFDGEDYSFTVPAEYARDIIDLALYYDVDDIEISTEEIL